MKGLTDQIDRDVTRTSCNTTSVEFRGPRRRGAAPIAIAETVVAAGFDNAKLPPSTKPLRRPNRTRPMDRR